MRGITHLCVNTMGLGLPGPEEHVRTLERFKGDLEGYCPSCTEGSAETTR
jgi:hypothetical protein